MLELSELPQVDLLSSSVPGGTETIAGFWFARKESVHRLVLSQM